jgi:hypothetical protein
MADPLLEVISEDLRAQHGCHTVILYGSRARGDATATSDYDVLGVKESGDSFRDARLWNGVYLDIFIHPSKRSSRWWSTTPAKISPAALRSRAAPIDTNGISLEIRRFR